MNLLDRLERRFGRYAPENITVWLIAGQVMVFVASYLRPDGAGGLIQRLTLDPAAIYAGEVWRLVTFLFLAPLGAFPIFVLFFWYLFYLMGTVLEVTWGSFRYNAFLGLGWFASVAASFLADWIQPGFGYGVGDYLYGSVFLAFARLHPDFTIHLFFVLPVKIKWLALLQWLGYGFTFLFGDWYSRLLALAATLNYFVFFGADVWRDVREGRRQMQRQAKTLRKPPPRVTHECRVCGLTSDMAPKTAFRYCSKCAGACCYCPEHLKDHECVVEGNDG